MNMQVSVDGINGIVQDDGMVRFNPDDRMNVMFYIRPVHDPIKSSEMGRPWTVPMEYVKIQQPGEKDFSDRPVTDFDKRRFARQYAQYQKSQVQAPSGTDVSILFPQNPELPINLKSVGIHTIEQLAGLTEHGANTLGMGATQWRNKAVQYLDAAKGGVSAHKMQAALEKRDEQIEMLQNQLSSQRGEIDRLMAMMKQNIPASMVPPPSQTLAQSAFAGRKMTFQNDGPDEAFTDVPMSSNDFPAPRLEQPDGPALFVEAAADDHHGNTMEPIMQKRRGRPPRSGN